MLDLMTMPLKSNPSKTKVVHDSSASIVADLFSLYKSANSPNDDPLSKTFVKIIF
jgi:hypothetical protein